MTKKSFLSPQNQVSDLCGGQVGLDLELFRFLEMEFLALPGGISDGIEQEGGGEEARSWSTPCAGNRSGVISATESGFWFYARADGCRGVKHVSWDS